MEDRKKYSISYQNYTIRREQEEGRGNIWKTVMAENTLEIGKSLVCITSSFSDFPSPGMEKVV